MSQARVMGRLPHLRDLVGGRAGRIARAPLVGRSRARATSSARCAREGLRQCSRHRRNRPRDRRKRHFSPRAVRYWRAGSLICVVAPTPGTPFDSRLANPRANGRDHRSAPRLGLTSDACERLITPRRQGSRARWRKERRHLGSKRRSWCRCAAHGGPRSWPRSRAGRRLAGW